MKAWILPAALCLVAGPAGPPRSASAASPLKELSRRTIAGFRLKKTTHRPNGVVELWDRSADRAQLRIEIITRADDATAAARLKAVNARIPKKEPQSEELMFRYQTSVDTKAWTNYRATHHITFKTYRFWRLRNNTLVLADLSFLRGKPDFDAARMAFVTAKKAADSTMEAVLGSSH